MPTSIRIADGPRAAPTINSLWAKSPRSPGDCLGYPLLPHLLDVAAVAMELQHLVPCPVLLPSSAQWLAALVGFHDLGKATPGFQLKLGPGAGQGFTFPVGAPDRHDASTVPLLTQQLVKRGMVRADAWLLANAVGAHHGNLINPVDLQAAGRWQFSPEWTATHEQLFQQLLLGTGAVDLPVLPSVGAVRAAAMQWLMGLTTVADWIGSSDALCRDDRLPSWSGDPVSWFAASRQLAIEALAQVGLTSSSLKVVGDGAAAMALALGGWAARPLQSAVAEVINQLGDEPGLVVIEAPMGEGKSEAGLSLTCGSRGLYMAMPTQATSNALMGRVARFLDRAADGSVQLALAHGSGGPAVAANRLREVGLGTADSTVQAGWWFRGSKRSLLCPQGIGTVDQGLIGVLNARHGFVRLFGLSGRTVIFDELHAYDAYTGGLIERLVQWLQQLGCRVVIMSATLPAARRDSILQAWAGVDVAVPGAPYPRVTWAVPGRITATAFPASRRQQVEVKGIAPDAVAATAISMAQAGARVLVVVNKVARAQQLFTQLSGSVPATLFHARFPMDQRLEIEQSVLQQFGPGGTCTTGHVLVATQVAEQSLDIDMDVLITDPAPVDLLLQRAGRIHRHNRQRPAGFTDPLVLVAGLDLQVPPADLSSFIYDRWLVLRSHAWLQQHRLLSLPDDIDLAVQQVYGTWEPPATGELADAITAAWPDHQVEQQQMSQLAQQAALAEPPNWGIHQNTPPVDDDDAEAGAIRFGTRLGQDSVSVVPVTQYQLGNLPAHADFLAGHYLRISHRRLITAVRAQPWPPGWRELPGLARHHPLVLDADGQFIGGLAQLDPGLGLVVTSGGAGG